MSLGLSIAGTYAARGKQSRPAAPAAWLNELAQWAERALDDQLTHAPVLDDEGGEPSLSLSLHPCAEPVKVAAPDRGELRLTAMTSSAGPGYHQFVCDVMDQMTEELGVTWAPASDGDEASEEGSSDETGYFYARDRAALEGAMLDWLGALCKVFLRPGEMLDSRSPGDSPLLMAMPLGIMYEYDAEVLTPMGPRDRAWFEAAAGDPRNGLDFFSWWEEGETARTLLGRALALMWTEVRWVQAASEEVFAAQAEAAELLASAYEQDSSLDYPWREWAELMALVEWEGEPREEVEARAAEADRAAPLIGYRRRDVTAILPGGWTIRLPGSFSAGFDEEGGEFVASDGARTVRFSAMRMTGEGGAPPSMEVLLSEAAPEIGVEGERPLEGWARGRLTARGSIARIEEDGEETWMLASMITTDGGLALVTIYFDEDDQREWAMATWGSITHAGAEG